eukprot:gene21443-biopygen421
MDDLKVYSPTPKDLEKAIRVVERASRAIGMELGLRKCAIAHRNHRGQVEVHEEAESSYHGIPLLKEEDCYKYLGLQQLFRVNRSETGRQVLTKVNARVTELLKTDLNSANLTKALGCKIAGTMRYYIAAQVWTKGDMCTLDRQIRGLVDYLGKCLDGFGEQLWRCMYALETDRPGRRRQTVIGKARHVLSQLGLADDYLVEKQGLQLRRDDPDRKVSEYKAQIKRHFQAKAETELTGHVVHGRFYNLLKDERLERTLPHAWLVDGLLRPQTEGYIIAIQDGALLTKARRQVTTGRVATPRCRLCGEAPETISHIISSCSRHHHSAYKLRHDQALIPVLNALLQALGMGERICGERADPRPEYVCDRGSVLWDVMVQPDRKAYRPDMLVYDQEAKVITVVELTVPHDTRLEIARAEKLSKYRALVADLHKANADEGWRYELAVIVIGALGTMTVPMTADLKGHYLMGAEAIQMLKDAAAWSDVQCADPHGPSLLGLALRSSHFSPERVNGCSVSSDKASGKVGGCSGTCCYSPTDDSSSDGAEESGTCSASAGWRPSPDVMSSTADCLQCVGTAWRHAGGLRTRCASVVGGHMASSDPS